MHSGRLHNLFLNVYDLGGIIPFGFLVLFSVEVARKLKGVLKNSALNAGAKTLLLLLFILVFVQMMLEPVMESVPVFVWCFLYIAGAVHKVERQ